MGVSLGQPEIGMSRGRAGRCMGSCCQGVLQHCCTHCGNDCAFVSSDLFFICAGCCDGVYPSGVLHGQNRTRQCTFVIPDQPLPLAVPPYCQSTAVSALQAAVMEYIPVVFFTAKGIPGEVEERLDTPAGLVAASMRAVGLGEC